jgi:hypothetical protein
MTKPRITRRSSAAAHNVGDNKVAGLAIAALMLATAGATSCEPGATPPAERKLGKTIAENPRRARRAPAHANRASSSTQSYQVLSQQSHASCCEAHPLLGWGCGDIETEIAVCNSDMYCCTAGWDEQCYMQAVETGACALPVGDRSEACCETHQSTGCTDAAVSACVGELDPYCITVAWDGTCLSMAQNLCGAGCSAAADCCEPHPGAGCSDPAVEACVVALDSFCGDYAWGTKCALIAAESCTSCAPLAPGPEACCTASTDGDKGCNDGAVQDCLCIADPWCCDIEWDATCVKRAAAEKCTECVAADGTGGCCRTREVPGCGNDTKERCVCDVDPFCCDVAWDAICVNTASELGCANCSERSPDNDCCEASNKRGCEDGAVQECVCQQDPFCCTVGWDAQCAAHVLDFDCGVCAERNNGECCDVARAGRAGCGDPAVEACVCAEDAYCCDIHWDSYCVEEVGIYDCGSGGAGDLIFEAGNELANFGSVPGHPEDRTGWGQSVIISGSAVALRSFGFEFASGFGEPNTWVGLRVWDDQGGRVLTSWIQARGSFTGGWLRWPEHGSFHQTLEPGTYTFLTWTWRGPAQAAPRNASIKYADASASTPAGTAFTMTGDRTAAFNAFPADWTAVADRDLNYRINTAGLCQ